MEGENNKLRADNETNNELARQIKESAKLSNDVVFDSDSLLK